MGTCRIPWTLDHCPPATPAGPGGTAEAVGALAKSMLRAHPPALGEHGGSEHQGLSPLPVPALARGAAWPGTPRCGEAESMAILEPWERLLPGSQAPSWVDELCYSQLSTVGENAHGGTAGRLPEAGAARAGGRSAVCRALRAAAGGQLLEAGVQAGDEVGLVQKLAHSTCHIHPLQGRDRRQLSHGQEGGRPGHHQYPRACFSVSLPPLSHLPRGAPWDPLVLPGVCLALQTHPAHFSVPSLRCPCVRCGLLRASPPPSAGGGTVTNPAACSGC